MFYYNNLLYIMLSIREIVLYILTSVYFIETTAYLLDSKNIGHFKLFYSNCELIKPDIVKSPASLGVCTFLCIMTSTCKGFFWRHEECGLMQRCPSCCTHPLSAGKNGGWLFYCPSSYGKMHNVVPTYYKIQIQTFVLIDKLFFYSV